MVLTSLIVRITISGVTRKRTGKNAGADAGGHEHVMAVFVDVAGSTGEALFRCYLKA